MLRKIQILWKEHGLLLGSTLALGKFIRKLAYFLKIIVQNNFLYKVPEENWKKALNVQFQRFSEDKNYPFYRAREVDRGGGNYSELRNLLIEEAKAFLDTYEKLGYPFTRMFQHFVPSNARVLQLGIGACPELAHLAKEIGFDYYVEDPLFHEIFRSVDLREVFKEEIKEFCNLPAETMWVEYQEFFDVIVCHNVLNHTYDPGKVIDSISKMLRLGGLVFDFTMRQGARESHPGVIGHRALIRGYTSRGFEVVYSAVFKHLDYPSALKKHRYYTLLRKRLA